MSGGSARRKVLARARRRRCGACSPRSRRRGSRRRARARAKVDDGAARAKRLAALAKWSREWRSRLAESATTAQLALRLVEVEFATFERNEGSHRMGAGDAIEMNFDDEWKRGTVLGVFRDGAFRASAKMSDKTGDFDQYEDFLPPKSRDGKQVGKDFYNGRRRSAPRAHAAKGYGARTVQYCTRQ